MTQNPYPIHQARVGIYDPETGEYKDMGELKSAGLDWTYPAPESDYTPISLPKLSVTLTFRSVDYDALKAFFPDPWWWKYVVRARKRRETWRKRR